MCNQSYSILNISSKEDGMDNEESMDGDDSYFDSADIKQEDGRVECHRRGKKFYARSIFEFYIFSLSAHMFIL